MSTTTVNLGYVPKNRGEYSSTASYYKDNIVQYNGSSYICNPPNYDPDTAPTSSITGVAPYDSDPAVPNTGWAVFCNDSSGVGEGVYNVSVDHTTDNNPKVYVSLSAALQDIPQAKKKGGMEIRFIFNNSDYAVDKEEGITTQPAGTAITSSPTMVDGTYKASQLVTYFSTLPTATGAGNAVVYYKEVDGTYTTWTITLQSSDNNYIQVRCTADEFTTDITKWQGVDDVPTPNSPNLALSNGVAFEHALQNIVVAKCAISNSTWDGSGTRKHLVIPVNGGERVEWTGYSTLYYALLTDYPNFPKGGDTPTFLTGYSGRQWSSSAVTIPSDCKYLIINNPDNYTDIIINGRSIVRGLWTALLQKINQYGIEDNAITLAKLANDVVGDGIEHINYKKSEIIRDSIANSKADYINKRAIYEKNLNIDGALDVNGFKNLFVPKYRKSNTGVPPTEDSTGGPYDSTQFIAIQQEHTYKYQLAGSSSVYLIAEYDSNDSLIVASSIKGTNGVKKGTYIPSSTAVKVVLCNNCETHSYPAFIDVTDNVYAFKDYVDSIKEDIEDLQNNTISDNDLTYVIASKNIANPANIFDGGINNEGVIRNGSQLVGWKAIMIPVTEGQVVSFGGFYLGRDAYAAFYNNDTIVGNRLYFSDPQGGVKSDNQNISVPIGANKFYIDIQTSNSTIPEGDTTPYDHLMVNVGATLLPYEPFEQKISEINGIEISGADETLEPRVTTLEGTVSQQGTDITNLGLRVTALENTDIIEDLPISDGTGISVGYAYIDSTTGTVKVKMS